MTVIIVLSCGEINVFGEGAEGGGREKECMFSTVNTAGKFDFKEKLIVVAPVPD